ncbi:hypothetical protein EES47_19855 [Streptomyces sp. ADI98-12]|uniref:Collagen triple helix repeat-containing protein n=1 Tax=Streptomyces griseus TaxID=1911 RepID=A0A380P372_STRGR|nr:hypothetical protein EES47_19855 [Streptomyces sp. ADI98-12]SUP59676.1 Uncharacterised protein [Streptomyces griseus]
MHPRPVVRAREGARGVPGRGVAGAADGCSGAGWGKLEIMSFLDNLKAKIAPAKEKVADLTRQHGDKIDQGLDKAAQAVDSRTKGRYSDKIRTGTDKAKSALDQLNEEDGKGKGGPAGGGRASGPEEDATRPQHPETGTRRPEGEGPAGS